VSLYATASADIDISAGRRPTDCRSVPGVRILVAMQRVRIVRGVMCRARFADVEGECILCCMPVTSNPNPNDVAIPSAAEESMLRHSRRSRRIALARGFAEASGHECRSGRLNALRVAKVNAFQRLEQTVGLRSAAICE
jgi:hypothetical protein